MVAEPNRLQAEDRSPATYAAFVGTCLIWGSTFLAIRFGTESVPPVWGATIRLAIAAVLCFVVMKATGGSFPRGAALRAAFVFGALNLGVNFVLLYWGEQTVPSGTAAVLYATIPISTGIFSALLGVHPLSRVQLLSAVIGLLGVVLIFSGELSIGAPAKALVAVFTGATCASFSTVIVKKAPPQSTWALNSFGAAVGSCVCLLGSLVLGESHPLPQGWTGWGPILYLAILGNLGAYALYGWLITKWKVTSASIAALIIPVIAVILGAIVKGEAPPPTTYAGAALVLTGVAVALFGGRKPAPAART
jgi:drug/metabolite transporter (DMT)-like permease